MDFGHISADTSMYGGMKDIFEGPYIYVYVYAYVYV
jgi:hypothetical protein